MSSRSCDPAYPADTAFGSSISTFKISAADSLAQVDDAFGQVPVVRTFDPGMPLAWNRPRNKILEGRDIVTSFRPPPRDVLSGVHDDFFRRWFAEAPRDVHVYWSYIHEPEPLIAEGAFTRADYFAAWEHLAALADEGCNPRLHPTLILTGFTASNPDRDYRRFDPGPEIVDVIAWDPYNGVYQPERDYYESPESLLGPIVELMANDGRRWGIAEIGSRVVPGDDGSRRAAWLTEVAEYARANDVLFVTYFQSRRGANWRLDDEPSRRVWSALVADSS
ncbi:hypothetical protein BH23ACT6_BH23ACT6_15530 [soil metagenome]